MHLDFIGFNAELEFGHLVFLWHFFMSISNVVLDSWHVSLTFRANAEIAQVKSRAKQDQAVYQASLRKEQMKVDSLERTLEQKVRREMSRICKNNTDITRKLL